MFGLTPSQDQVVAQLRLLLPALGSMAIMLGIMSPDLVGKWTTLILTAIGPAMIIGGMIWSLIANSKKSIITSVANMPEVQKIKLEPTVEARQLEAVTPENVKVST